MPCGDLADALQRQCPRVDRLPALRLLGELGDIEIAVGRQHQGARDRCRRHDEQVDGVALRRQRHALVHAEPVLLVDHDHGEVGELDILLHQRVRADHELDRAVGEALQGSASSALAVAAGQQRDLHAGGFGERRDGREMLARQQARSAPSSRPARRPRRRSAWRAAPPASCRCRHRPAAAAPCALPWPDRRRSRRWPASGWRSARSPARRGRPCAGGRRPWSNGPPACGCDGAPARWRAGWPAARRRRGGRGQGARAKDRPAPRAHARAATAVFQSLQPCFLWKAGVLPFGEARRALDGSGDGLLHRLLREAGGQAVDRLDPQDGIALLERHDMVGVRHLHLALVDLDLAAHHARLAGRQQLLEIVLAAVEVGEAEPAALVAAPDLVGLARDCAGRCARPRSR